MALTAAAAAAKKTKILPIYERIRKEEKKTHATRDIHSEGEEKRETKRQNTSVKTRQTQHRIAYYCMEYMRNHQTTFMLYTRSIEILLMF